MTEESFVRVLVVDDDPTILETYRRILDPAAWGLGSTARDENDGPALATGDRAAPEPLYELVLCSQGDEAVARVEESVAAGRFFALVFLDLRLPPGPDGMWTAKKIRELSPATEIVVVTAYTDVPPQEIARRTPPLQKIFYLQKPFHAFEIKQFALALSAKFRAERLLEASRQRLEDTVKERTAELSRVNQQLEADIARRKEVENYLLETRSYARNIIDSSLDMIVTVDPDRRIFEFNRAARDTFGYSLEEVRGRHIKMLYADPAEGKRIAELIFKQGSFMGEIINVRKNGEIFPCLLSASVMYGPEDEIIGVVGNSRDITQRKLAEEKIKYQADHDLLTGLPNRACFMDLLTASLARARKSKEKVLLLYFDPDGFKNINERFGHPAGDEVLRQIGRRLTEALPQDGIAARFEGDDFMMVIPGIKNTPDVVDISERVSGAFNTPFSIGANRIQVDASIGATIFPDDGGDLETLLKHADLAMYRAKTQHGNTFSLFTPAMHSEVVRRLSLEENLRQAIEQGEFVLHYQPKADLVGGEVVGMEALVRWVKPEEWLVSPAEFIPVAEDTGLMGPLGQWILETACLRTRAWHQAGYGRLAVSVNISPAQFISGDIISSVEKALDISGLEPALLDLEITESSVQQNVDSMVRTLSKLRDMGVTISIDDFGTGYTNMAQLRRFPIKALKIDRLFISGTPFDEDDAAITKTIVSMAHNLGLKVVAEGVETGEQLSFLKSIGCDEMQGFLFSKPLPDDEFEIFIKLGHKI